MSLTHDELRALAMVATPGPWAWSINKRSRDVRLYAQHSGQLTVMDFVRYGMQSAQPRFRVPPIDIMQEMSECHPHPDANYIAAANPATVLALLDEVTRLRAAATSSADALYRYHLIGMINGHDYGLCVEEDECRICTTIRTLRAAIEEAPQ